jgi:polyhydroxybutyrate depolymerase
MVSDRSGRAGWPAALTIVFALASFLLASCGSASQVPGARAESVHGFQANSVYLRTTDGRLRSYLLYVPPGAATGRPLVLVFHGAGATADQAAQETDFLQAANQEGFIVAFLQGFEDTWNEGAGHTPARVAGVNDVAFTAGVLNQIEGRYSVDRSRIAAAGFSNGALLSELLGCRLAARLTLVAPVEGPLPVSVSPSCRPARAISVLEVHGTADEAIPYGGGHFVGSGGGTTVLSAPASAARWGSLDGCRTQGQAAESAHAAVLTTYSACHAHVLVELRSIQGGGHGWPDEVGVLVANFLHEHPRAPA